MKTITFIITEIIKHLIIGAALLFLCYKAMLWSYSLGWGMFILYTILGSTCVLTFITIPLLGLCSIGIRMDENSLICASASQVIPFVIYIPIALFVIYLCTFHAYQLCGNYGFKEVITSIVNVGFTISIFKDAITTGMLTPLQKSSKVNK